MDKELGISYEDLEKALAVVNKLEVKHESLAKWLSKYTDNPVLEKTTCEMYEQTTALLDAGTVIETYINGYYPKGEES